MMGYPIETVIAEKYEAMIALGVRNSRYKDFYDIRCLSQMYELEGYVLQQALVNTFRRRGTVFSRGIYEPDYLQGKEKLWSAFEQRIHSDSIVPFVEVIDDIRRFLLPVQEACEQGTVFELHWDGKAWGHNLMSR